MFTRKFLTDSHLRRIIDCQAIRSIRSRIKIPVHLKERNAPLKKFPKDHLTDVRKSNVGIGHSLAAHLEYFGKDIDDDFDPEEALEDPSLDDVKPRIQNFSADLQKKEQIKSFLAVKKKYFRPEKLPGMLTYAEKQQMIHLHKEDPDYWDAHKLAEGFPATPEIVQKVLKVKFVAYTVKQILRHDEFVRKNWEAFEKGELKFNDELQKIYSSFVGRSHLVTDEKEMEKFIPPPPDFAANIPVQEFGNIIASSEKHQLEAENRRKQVDVDDQGRFVYHSKHGKADIIDESRRSLFHQKHDTLDTFRAKIGDSKRMCQLDQIIVAAEPMKQIEQSPTTRDVKRKEEHYKQELTSGTGVISKDFNPFMAYKKNPNYPMRINIPPKLWKKDKLYRVRDCFYADDGFFLYRVPGLERLP